MGEREKDGRRRRRGGGGGVRGGVVVVVVAVAGEGSSSLFLLPFIPSPLFRIIQPLAAGGGESTLAFKEGRKGGREGGREGSGRVFDCKLSIQYAIKTRHPSLPSLPPSSLPTF